MSDAYALILAGGSGTRFWPLSRDARPKQLLDLFGNATLINQTVQRLEGLVPKENILILTNKLQEEAVRKLCSDIPSENIFAEPDKKDTAPAVALGIGLIAARDPEATMLVLPADQLINDTASYHSIMNDAINAAQHSSALITVGIKPTWACPSFGYIERGEVANLNVRLHTAAHVVKRFREKPNTELAEKFLKQGHFAWNAGMFIWSINSVMAELERQTPELYKFVNELTQCENIQAYVEKKFLSLTPISVDYAIMENAKQVLNIEASFDWDDVGSWISVSKYLESQESNKTNSPLVEIDSQNNIVFTKSTKKQVALLGVDDLIVVETEDSILVANRHQADDIKKLINKLPKELR